MRSKSLEDLKAELIQVAANGYREVVLVGINLSAYGLDEDFDLADAVECACSVDGIDRVRLGSIEPERMDKEMIARLAAQPKFCPQFHLSLQSGCDNTLKEFAVHLFNVQFKVLRKTLCNGMTGICAPETFSGAQLPVIPYTDTPTL